MTQTIRKYVDLPPEQARELEQRSRELGLSESEIIRRCLEQGKTIRDIQLSDVEKHRLFQELLDFVDQRARRLPGRNEPRTWTREELYEDYEVDSHGNPLPR